MATRIQELEDRINKKWESYQELGLGPEYNPEISGLIEREIEPLGDESTAIKDFDIDSETGEVTKIKLALMGVKEVPVNPETFKDTLEIVRGLGYQDLPEKSTISRISLKVRARKNDQEFKFEYFPEHPGSVLGLEKGIPIAYVEFPMEMKEKIPKITGEFLDYFKK